MQTAMELLVAAKAQVVRNLARELHELAEDPKVDLEGLPETSLGEIIGELLNAIKTVKGKKG